MIGTLTSLRLGLTQSLQVLASMVFLEGSSTICVSCTFQL